MNSTGKLRYDLHSHSNASDGELTPTELIKHAAGQGVDVFALTDHDCTAGLAEAAEEAARQGIQFISGVEISATWNKHLIHIVGLNFDPDSEAMQAGLADLRDQRVTRAEEMARRLERKAKIGGALEGAKQYSNGQSLSRTHFAQFLLNEGHVSTLQDAFNKYLGIGKPAYVSSEWCSMEQAVQWITDAGGVAVIAHPARYKLSATKLRNLIGDFKAAGGIGFEVVSGSQDINDSRNMADYARRFELLASVGSDYHGPSQAWLKMSNLPPLPKDCTPVWTAWEGSDA